MLIAFLSACVAAFWRALAFGRAFALALTTAFLLASNAAGDFLVFLLGRALACGVAGGTETGGTETGAIGADPGVG